MGITQPVDQSKQQGQACHSITLSLADTTERKQGWGTLSSPARKWKHRRQKRIQAHRDHGKEVISRQKLPAALWVAVASARHLRHASNQQLGLSWTHLLSDTDMACAASAESSE
jgi:hypothetical protein